MPRLSLASFIVCLVWTIAAPAQAKPTPFEYLTHRGKQQIRIDTTLVAVAGKPTPADTLITMTESIQAFADMGVGLISTSKVTGDSTIVGYPVWFSSGNQKAVGILTQDIIVRLKPGAQLKVFEQAKGLEKRTRLNFLPDLYELRFETPLSALEGANRLQLQSDVLYAHPNFYLNRDWRRNSAQQPAKKVAREPLHNDQWHVENRGQFGGRAGADANIIQAWNVTKGESSIVIAVLDGGFDMEHSDLQENWWQNRGEIPGNGIDDDRNGYRDDVQGWNFYRRNNRPDEGIRLTHGTSVAGLAGAPINGRGIAGACPECTILPIALSWKNSDDAAAIIYAAEAGADIISNSWGYPIDTPTTAVVEDALEQVANTGRDGKGAITLFAMNNMDVNDCVRVDAETGPDISSLETVVAVSASSDLDKKVRNAAWGPCMEVLAPSFEFGRKGMTTTDVRGDKGYNKGTDPDDLEDTDYTNEFNGTSASTPLVAGVFGLMLSVNPDLTRDQAVGLLVSSAVKIDPTNARYDARTGFSTTHGYGRIDAFRAIQGAKILRKYTRTKPGKPAGPAAATATPTAPAPKGG